LVLLLTEGNVSDCRGAATVLADRHDADAPIADTGCDSGRFREAPTGLRIERCIPGRSDRKTPISFDADLHKQRNRAERMFGGLEDWRLIATRYHRCAHTCVSAIHIAATVIFWS